MTHDTHHISRRRFLVGAGAAAIASGQLSVPALASSRRGPRALKMRVAILGGGVGGLTAAHELAERGFDVTVFEPKALGGKARSIPIPGTAKGGRHDLPGEHGFRFFPGFYKNIPDTMRRIPVNGNPNGVLDNLVTATETLIVFKDSSEKLYTTPRFDETGFERGVRSLVTLWSIGSKIPPNESEYVLRKLMVFLTSSDERRVGQWERVSWWDFVNAEHFSPKYQRVWGNGITKDLVAAKGTKASTRTIGLMAEAFLLATMAQSSPELQRESGYGAPDRLLNAPTNEAWIAPWVAHLRSLGVKFVHGYAARRLHVRGGRIVGADVVDAAGRRLQVDADWFVAAMPVEKARVLFDAPVRALAPELAGLDKLEYDYMNGIQFFLNRIPPRAIRGHVAFVESPWALTSINQGLFWKRDLPRDYGDGHVGDVLSVDISDWFTPGILYKRPAVRCTPIEIANECWAQMKQGLNAPNDEVLTDDMVVRWFLDPAITHPEQGPAFSTEPLLINTPGSLRYRPDSHTSVPNLFLASDYVRVDVDLATMEGANEAGRQAANAVLQRSGSNAAPAVIQRLWQPPIYADTKRADAALYKAGQPNVLDVMPSSVPA